MAPAVDPVVVNLSKLPREMVHRILDDLPLITILGLAAHHCDRETIGEAIDYVGTSFSIFLCVFLEAESRDICASIRPSRKSVPDLGRQNHEHSLPELDPRHDGRLQMPHPRFLNPVHVIPCPGKPGANDSLASLVFHGWARVASIS